MQTVPLEQVVFGGKTVEVVHKVKTHRFAVAPKPSVYCVQPEPFFLLSRPPSMNREGPRGSDLNVMGHTTAIVKSLVASALPSGNAPFLPENCYNYKFFGIHIFLYVVCIGPTQKNWRKPPKSDIFPHPNSTPPKMG